MPTMVKLKRDMKPWREGQDAVLPDDMAKKMVAEGEAEDPRPFPPQDVKPAVEVGKPTLEPKRYMTRKQRRASIQR